MIQDGTTSPQIYNDVFSIMTDQKLYNDNIEHKHSLYYYIEIGMFRTVHNKWAKYIAGEWIRNKNIFLKHINYDGTPIMRRKSHKGFLISNICHQVSNFMTENVSLIMQKNNKEYINSHNKTSSKRSRYNYTETKFGNYQEYLFTIKDDLSETNG